jgi:signal recognition particle GTPase
LGLRDRLRGGLLRTREALTTPIEDLVRGRRPLDASALASVEEALLAADLGLAAVAEAMEVLRARSGEIAAGGLPAMRGALRDEIRRALERLRVEGAAAPHEVLDRSIEHLPRAAEAAAEALDEPHP